MFEPLLVACAIAALLSGAFGAALAWTAMRWPPATDDLAHRLDAVLPQTQCGQCSFAGCRPYAEAMARGEASIDRCPPGGERTLRALAGLLGREPVTPGPPRGTAPGSLIALIDEDRCIGCARCLPACPVDAIVGASRRMHTVIAEHCTGCGLCLPPCPVDCITLQAPENQPRRAA